MGTHVDNESITDKKRKLLFLAQGQTELVKESSLITLAYTEFCC
jgi:hypothetical protein